MFKTVPVTLRVTLLGKMCPCANQVLKGSVFWAYPICHTAPQLTDNNEDPQEEEHSSEDQTTNPHRLVVWKEREEDFFAYNYKKLCWDTL